MLDNFSSDLPQPGSFANEEVPSDITYPLEYTGPRPIDEQIELLAEIFDLGPAPALQLAKHLPALPEGAEGWFAIPRWEKLGQLSHGLSSYGRAVDRVLTELKYRSASLFQNYCEDGTDADYLRQHTKTIKAFLRLEHRQNGNEILIVPCQFGLRHRGRSICRARELMGDRTLMVDNEFGLGAFAAGCMLLTHPERGVMSGEKLILDIDCAGDEYALELEDGFVFAGAPNFSFDGEAAFDAVWCNLPTTQSASVSGFLSH